MNTIKINKGNTKIIAHRGLSGLECENTCAAFVAAGNRSYFGIETDVHITADGIPVIFHDDNTKRISGVDMNVETSSYEQLKKIRLYDMESGKYRSDLVIALMHEYIRICKRYEKIAVVELKGTMKSDDFQQIVCQINEENYLEHTIFISFVWNTLVEIKRLIPDSKVQFLTNVWDDALCTQLAEKEFDLDIYYKELTKERVEQLHKSGIEVNCWTCDNKEDAKRLISWGVDYITSNILE